MTSTPNPEIRVVNDDDTLGEILPDWRTLDYMDDSVDVGSVTLDYPERGGLRRNLLKGRREYAITLDGDELPNGRFLLDASSGNRASDTPGYVTWAGKTLLARLDEAVVMPTNDEARLDVLTVEERHQFQQARDQWVQKQIRKVRKAHRKTLEEMETHPKDDQKDDSVDLLEEMTGHDDGMLDEMSGGDEAVLDTPKLHDIHWSNIWKVKLTPAYWRHRFEPDSDMQERLDTAPPPVAPTFKNETPGHIARRLVRMAHERGAIPEIEIGFTDDRDSNGEPWRNRMTLKPEVGSTLLTHLRDMTERKKAEPRMRGRTLQLFNSDLGEPGEASVLFARGKNIVDGPQETDSEEYVNAVFCMSDTGVHGWVWDKDKVDADGGTIEGTLEVEGVQTWRELRRLGREYLRENGRQKQQNTFGITALKEEGTRPYKDFGVASWVNIADEHGIEQQRIRAITLSWDESRNMAAGVTLNDRLYEKDVVADRRIKAMYGRTTSTAKRPGFAAAASGHRESDARPPKKPSMPGVSSRNGAIEVSYDWRDEDGYDAIWDQDHVEVHMSTEPDYEVGEDTLQARLTTAGSVVLTREPYQESRYVRFVAVDRGGDRSEPSDVNVISAAYIDGSKLDPTGPEFPPPLIPGVSEMEEGLLWEGFAKIDNLIAGRLQVDMSVAGRILVFQYADPEDPDSGIAENSAVIELSYDKGLTMWTPVLDDAGNWLYAPEDPNDPTSPLKQVRHQTVSFPVAAFERDDPNDPLSPWHQIAAIFNGEVEAANLTVSGPFELGGTQTVAIGGGIILANAVTDPDTAPGVSFGANTQNWPGSSGFEEIGFGRDGPYMVQGRLVDDDGVMRVTARFINPDGTVHHSQQLSIGFYAVGGFTCVGGFIYVLDKFSSGTDPWAIHRFAVSDGVYTGHFRNVDPAMGGGFNTGALGAPNPDGVIADRTVAFAFRDGSNNLTIRYYNLLLENHPGLANQDNVMTTGRPLRGVPAYGVVGAGPKFFVIEGTTRMQDKEWETDNGNMTGCGYVSGLGFVSTDGTGTLTVYNDEHDITDEADFSHTRVNTVSGAESAQGPYNHRTWPARKWATVETPPIGAGYDDVNVYVGKGSRLTQFRVNKPAGVQAVVSYIPTTGTNPPAESTFTATGTPAFLRSQGKIPGTSRPMTDITADGFAEIYGLRHAEIDRRRSSSVTVPHGYPGVKLPFGVEITTDPDLIWDAANDRVTAGMAGLYLVSTQVTWQSVAGGYRMIRILVNGLVVAESMTAGGSATGSGLTKPIRMVAGDYLEIWAVQNSGANLDTRGGEFENFLNVYRIGA